MAVLKRVSDLQGLEEKDMAVNMAYRAWVMQFPSRRKSKSYVETSPGIQANSRIMAPGKGEAESLFPTASRRLADDSQLSKPRDSQQIHPRTLETAAEICSS